jgi:predicted TIM-barrel fold metal-dependent hydrolase
MASDYQGAIIDTHHHLWDLSMERHPWLFKNSGGVKSLGDLSALQRDYSVDDYLQDTAGQNLVASVHVEAHWEVLSQQFVSEFQLILPRLRDGGLRVQGQAF